MFGMRRRKIKPVNQLITMKIIHENDFYHSERVSKELDSKGERGGGGQTRNRGCKIVRKNDVLIRYKRKLGFRIELNYCDILDGKSGHCNNGSNIEYIIP